MAKILLIQWADSAYDSLRFILDLVAQELIEDGHVVERVIVGQDGWADRLQHLISGAGPWHIALGMSGVGLEVGPREGGRIWDTAKIPFFTWFCDHPAHFPARHAVRSPYCLLGYVFPDHARYARDHINANGATFAVHLGLPRRATFAGAPRAWQSRNGRIAFFKSGGDADAMRASWRQQMPPLLATILHNAAEACAGADVASMTGILRQVAEQHDLFLAPDGKLCLTLLHHLDFFERARRTTLVMRSLLDVPVDVYGDGWAHVDWSGRRAMLHAPLAFPAMMASLPGYLGSLSVNPLVSESVHDRVFFALAAGVVPVSDQNRFLAAHMPALAAYAYDFSPDSVIAAAEALLTNPRDALERAEATYQALLPRYSLQQSARRIVEVCGLHVANAKA